MLVLHLSWIEFMQGKLMNDILSKDDTFLEPLFSDSFLSIAFI